MRYLILLLASITLFSCDDFLDESPKGKIIPETVDDMGGMLASTMTSNQNNMSSTTSGGAIFTDDVKLPKSKLGQYEEKELNAAKFEDHVYLPDETDKDWNAMYKCIYTTNWILENIDDAPEGDDKKFNRNEVKARALFQRANAFFQLVNLYGKHYDTTTSDKDLGVPMPLESDINIRHERASVKKVYDQVYKDLTASLEHLPTEKAYEFGSSKGAAYGMLSRYHLYKGEYKKSLEFTNKCLEQNDFLYDFNKLKKINSWVIIGLPGMSWFNKEVTFCVLGGSFFRPTYLSDELLNMYDKNNDLRYKVFVRNKFGVSVDKAGYRLSRFPFSGGINVSEMYLTKAECQVRTEDVEGALETLNKLRKSRYKTGTPKVTETNPDKLLRIILDERRKEMVNTGQRHCDLKRLNKDPRFKKTIERHVGDKIYKLEPNSNKYAMPIPRIVITRNSKIKQNPR